MPDIYLIKQGRALLPVNDSDAEAIDKLKRGEVYKAAVTAPRNLKFHRKTFALLNLAFSYWQPQSLVSEVETRTVENLKSYMAAHGVTGEAIDALCTGFLAHLNKARQDHESAKDFESFREFVTVKAGFFRVVDTPAGRRKVAKSISFAQMDEVDFGEFYKQLLNVCWLICLNSVFENQEQLAAALLEFE